MYTILSLFLLPLDKYNQNSDVYESIYIEIFNKFIINKGIWLIDLVNPMAEHVHVNIYN